MSAQIEAITEYARRKWVEAGMPEGRSEEFWLAAEGEYFDSLKKAEGKGCHLRHVWKEGLLPRRVCGVCDYEQLTYKELCKPKVSSEFDILNIFKMLKTS